MCTGTFCLVLVVVLNLLAYVGIAKVFVTPDHQLSKLLNLMDTPATALSLTSLRKREAACEAILSAFEETGKESAAGLGDFKKVHFPSRADPDGRVPQLDLVGHYLPVLPSVGLAAESPTIVVVHGHDADSLHHTTATAAYYLRLAGFNVLLPNLRNHGESPDSRSGLITWGQEERFDVLGAWDVVVNDPNGVLGHKTALAKVGLMGFSMGGFISKIAFGEEAKIQALLVDGAVHDAKVLLERTVQSRVGMSFPLFPLAWLYVRMLIGGIDLTPDTELPKSPNGRKIANIHATDDEKVPIEQSELFEAALARMNQPPGGFNLVSTWHPKTIDCGSSGSEQCLAHTKSCLLHNRLQLTRQGEYCHFLCSFFSDALSFSGHCAACQQSDQQQQHTAVMLEALPPPPRL